MPTSNKTFNEWIKNHLGTIILGVLGSLVSVGSIAAWFTDNIKESFIEWVVPELAKEGIKPIPEEFDIQLDYAYREKERHERILNKHDSLIKLNAHFIEYQQGLNGVLLKNIYCDTFRVVNGYAIHKLCKYKYVEKDGFIYKADIEGNRCYIYEFNWRLKQGESNRIKL